MLTVESVSKKFKGGNYGVRDVSLSVGGGVLKLLGTNGAGKTTLMQMIATITRPTSGRILFSGCDIGREPEQLRRRLGYLPPDFGVESIATEIAIMKHGSLVALGSAEELLRRAEGSVWEFVVSSERFERMRAELIVSNAVRRADGVHVRTVGERRPVADATSAEPRL